MLSASLSFLFSFTTTMQCVSYGTQRQRAFSRAQHTNLVQKAIRIQPHYPWLFQITWSWLEIQNSLFEASCHLTILIFLNKFRMNFVSYACDKPNPSDIRSHDDKYRQSGTKKNGFCFTFCLFETVSWGPEITMWPRVSLNLVLSVPPSTGIKGMGPYVTDIFIYTCITS